MLFQQTGDMPGEVCLSACLIGEDGKVILIKTQCDPIKGLRFSFCNYWTRYGQELRKSVPLTLCRCDLDVGRRCGVVQIYRSFFRQYLGMIDVRYHSVIPSAFNQIRGIGFEGAGDIAGEMCELLQQTCAEKGHDLYAAYRSNRVEWLLAMARRGSGAVILPESSIPEEPNLISLPIAGIEINRNIAALRYLHQPSRPEVEVLVQEMVRR